MDLKSSFFQAGSEGIEPLSFGATYKSALIKLFLLGLTLVLFPWLQ